MGGSRIAITEEDKGGYWDFTGVELPSAGSVECVGIWKDRALFSLKEDYTTSEPTITFPIEMFISLIEETVKTVSDKESWWSEDGLRERFAAALRLDLSPKPLETVRESRGRGRPRLNSVEKAKAKKAAYMKKYYARKKAVQEGTSVPINKV